MKNRQIAGGAAALLLFVIMAQPVSAQRAGRWTTTLWYSTVMGVSDTKDFAGDFSWRGFSMDVEQALTDDFTVGINTGWHVLSEKSQGTGQFDSGAISGTSFRYMNSVPLLLSANYFAGQQGGTRPFLGVGGGTYWIENRTDAGVFRVEDSNWHFGLMGEAGIVIRRPSRTLTLSARYNWALEKNDIEHTYLTFSIGFSSGG